MLKLLCFIFSFFFICSASASGSDADINMDISVSQPPSLQFAAPPDLIIVPSGAEYVYMVPDMSGVYFYRGAWYRYYENTWFRASVYDGAWAAIAVSAVPAAIVKVPPEYPFYVPEDYYRIKNHDALVRWKEWERIRHWNHFDWYKSESKPDVIEERHREIEKERTGGGHPEGRRHIEERRASEVTRPAEAGPLQQSRIPQAAPPAPGVREQRKQPAPGGPGTAKQQKPLQMPHRQGEPSPGKQLKMPHKPGQVEPEKQLKMPHMPGQNQGVKPLQPKAEDKAPANEHKNDEKKEDVTR